MTLLGKGEGEDEAAHLRRVADELGGANSSSVDALHTRLSQGDVRQRMDAAARLGMLGDRHSIAVLRGLLERSEPEEWELAVYGLRHSRDRAGWLCLESVALDLLPTLDPGTRTADLEHAFRLLVMGRTKTMDRLFRAIDGHSRSIPAATALTFSTVAVKSLPPELSTIIGLRLGIDGSGAIKPLAPSEVSARAGLSVEATRRLEAEGWGTLQQPRRYQEIRRNYEVNDDRFRASGGAGPGV